MKKRPSSKHDPRVCSRCGGEFCAACEGFTAQINVETGNQETLCLPCGAGAAKEQGATHVVVGGEEEKLSWDELAESIAMVVALQEAVAGSWKGALAPRGVVDVFTSYLAAFGRNLEIPPGEIRASLERYLARAAADGPAGGNAPPVPATSGGDTLH